MKKIIAISFLFVFTVLQYGKTLSYFYCEFKIEVMNEKSLKCDCEKIINDYQHTGLPASVPHSHSMKEKLNEPFTSMPVCIALQTAVLNTNSFASQSSMLAKGFENLPFHPPAMLS